MPGYIYDTELCHSKGPWKKHSYIRKIGEGRNAVYIYNNDYNSKNNLKKDVRRQVKNSPEYKRSMKIENRYASKNHILTAMDESNNKEHARIERDVNKDVRKNNERRARLRRLKAAEERKAGWDEEKKTLKYKTEQAKRKISSAVNRTKEGIDDAKETVKENILNKVNGPRTYERPYGPNPSYDKRVKLYDDDYNSRKELKKYTENEREKWLDKFYKDREKFADELHAYANTVWTTDPKAYKEISNDRIKQTRDFYNRHTVFDLKMAEKQNDFIKELSTKRKSKGKSLINKILGGK